MTSHAPGVEHLGTYRGQREKIPYLNELGVTAVELIPVHEFNEGQFYLGLIPACTTRNSEFSAMDGLSDTAHTQSEMKCSLVNYFRMPALT